MQAYGRRALRVDIRSSDLRRCIFILLSGRLNAFLSAPFVAVGHPSIHRFFRFHNRDKMAAVPASTVWFFFLFLLSYSSSFRCVSRVPKESNIFIRNQIAERRRQFSRHSYQPRIPMGILRALKMATVFWGSRDD